MIDEFFNFNLLLTLVCTQHVNKINWFQASLLEREWVLSQLSKLIWLEIDRHLPSPFLLNFQNTHESMFSGTRFISGFGRERSSLLGFWLLGLCFHNSTIFNAWPKWFFKQPINNLRLCTLISFSFFEKLKRSLLAQTEKTPPGEEKVCGALTKNWPKFW